MGMLAVKLMIQDCRAIEEGATEIELTPDLRYILARWVRERGSAWKLLEDFLDDAALGKSSGNQ